MKIYAVTLIYTDDNCDNYAETFFEKDRLKAYYLYNTATRYNGRYLNEYDAENEFSSVLEEDFSETEVLEVADDVERFTRNCWYHDKINDTYLKFGKGDSKPEEVINKTWKVSTKKAYEQWRSSHVESTPTEIQEVTEPVSAPPAPPVEVPTPTVVDAVLADCPWLR